MAQFPDERLQKALARLGLSSRREAEDWIRAGRLTVNGVVAHLGMRIRHGDQIRLDGRLVRQRPPSSTHVFLYHRSPGDPLREPAGTDEFSRGVEPVMFDEPAHTNEDAARTQSHEPKAPTNVQWRAPVQDRLPKRAGRRFIPISPMPNVDGGLELLSSDGELAEKLQRAVRTLQTEFSVRVHGELSDDQRRQLREGVLDRGTVEVLSLESGGGESSNRWYTIQTRGASGKEVRQLFERQGAIVSRIMRIRLGTVSLGRDLARGQFRKLTDDELEALTSAASGEEAPSSESNDAREEPLEDFEVARQERPTRNPNVPRRRSRDQSARGERPNDGSVDSAPSRSYPQRPRRDDSRRHARGPNRNSPSQRRDDSPRQSFAPSTDAGSDARRNSRPRNDDRGFAGRGRARNNIERHSPQGSDERSPRRDPSTRDERTPRRGSTGRDGPGPQRRSRRDARSSGRNSQSRADRPPSRDVPGRNERRPQSGSHRGTGSSGRDERAVRSGQQRDAGPSNRNRQFRDERAARFGTRRDAGPSNRATQSRDERAPRRDGAMRQDRRPANRGDRPRVGGPSQRSSRGRTSRGPRR